MNSLANIFNFLIKTHEKNIVIRRIFNKYFSLLQRRTTNKYKKRFQTLETPSKNPNNFKYVLTNDWIKKDEFSSDIANIQKMSWFCKFFISPPSYQESFSSNYRITKEKSVLKLLSSEKVGNRWIMFQKQEPQEDYVAEFDIKVNSIFSELQFAFHMEHLLKRYRFLITNNEKLNFEVVDNGFFLTAIHSVPLKFTLGEIYKIRIEIQNNTFSFYLNDKLKLAVHAKKTIKIAKKQTSMALILYERSPERIIDAEIYNYMDTQTT